MGAGVQVRQKAGAANSFMNLKPPMGANSHHLYNLPPSEAAEHTGPPVGPSFHYRDDPVMTIYFERGEAAHCERRLGTAAGGAREQGAAGNAPW